MGRFALRPRAISDIDGIWDYSVRQWDVARANRYIGEIRAAIERISENPQMGRPCGRSRPGHLKVLVGTHAVIYRFIAYEVVVMRFCISAWIFRVTTDLTPPPPA